MLADRPEEWSVEAPPWEIELTTDEPETEKEVFFFKVGVVDVMMRTIADHGVQQPRMKMKREERELEQPKVQVLSVLMSKGENNCPPNL